MDRFIQLSPNWKIGMNGPYPGYSYALIDCFFERARWDYLGGVISSAFP